jgi:hypothetical protein
MIVTLFALAFVGLVASGCGSGSSAPATTAASTTQPATPQKPPTLTALTTSVQAQITGTGSSDFSVGGVTKVTCTLPPTWATGSTFKCYAYDFADDELGEYDGTVQPASAGSPQWNGLWSPK